MQNLFTNLVIFSIIGMGWIIKKKGILTSVGLKEMNALLFMPLMPISFFTAALDFNLSLIKSWRFVAVGLGVYVLGTAVAIILAFARKLPKERAAVSILSDVRPNCIFIALPLITMWLGKQGADNMLMYIACCMPYFNIVPLLCSIIALNGKVDRGAILDALKGTFKNPILQWGIIGLIVGGLGFTPYIPEWVMRVLKLLGTTSTGLALIIIGAKLAPEKLSSDLKVAWPDICMKLIIHPAMMMIAFLLFPVENPISMRVAVVATAIAPAFNCFVIASGYGMDSDYAAMFVASATLVSMFTLMFWMSLVTFIFV